MKYAKNTKLFLGKSCKKCPTPSAAALRSKSNNISTIFQDLIIMSVTVSENIVPELKVSFNPTVVEESVDAEDAVLECLDGTRFAVVKRELAYYSGFFK